MASIMADIVGIDAVIIRPAIDELAKCIAEPIKRKFNYLCCFNDNVKDLENEAPKLEYKRREVQSRVNIAQNNAEILFPQVQTWLNKVSKIQIKMLEIESEISTVGCRYSLTKKVKKTVKAMKELRESGSFTTVSRSTFELDSRKHVEEEVMTSLRDEKTYMVGICGMGGVGKTTMANTIRHRARKELGFEETVMVVVSQDVDKLRIQDDIAKSLGLFLNGGSLSSKAHELRTRLSAGTIRCLIVIDDVWEKLELEELGIPCSNTCKVLITSRNSHILEAMDVEKLHAVQVLSETEAWELFKSKAGSCIEQQNVVAVARQVVDECKGLPLALVTVGMTLKDKASIPCWNTVLRQLKSANPSHMPEVIQSVYQSLRLQYESLEHEVQKTLFLLCCLFPENDDIPLRTLTNICMGLHMYDDITSSRDSTSTLVHTLKSRFLLLDGCNENHVKMHDVVRDVAIFIAAEEKRIKCNECTWISPNIGERIGAHVGSSLFPNLHLLWIDCESRDKELEIQNDFFDGMRELKVILIKCGSLQRLPETIGLLKNLQTLVLESCESLESISVVGELFNLEILICCDCRKIESLPVEIGRLSRLRLLELSGCWNLKTIAPGIISNLIKLEELIVEHFGGWEARIVEGERNNASLCELEHLSRLTSLTIEIRDSGLAAEKLHLSPRMLKFDITIGDGLNSYTSWVKTLRLESSRDFNLGKWIHECVRNVESLHLEGDGSTVLDLQVALNLKELDIRKCSTVKNLVNTSFHQLEHLRLVSLNELEEICDISNLKKLSSISIEECGRLRSLFSLLVMESGGCFLQLERLEIRYCEMMEQVVLWNEEEQNQINIHIPLLFPKLEHIKLYSLPNLTSFIKGIQATEFPQLHEIVIEDCPLLKDFVCNGSPAEHHGDDNDSIHFSCDPDKSGSFTTIAYPPLPPAAMVSIKKPEIDNEITTTKVKKMAKAMKESEKLEEARYELHTKVNTAQNNAETVAPHVQTWLDEVSVIEHKMPVIDDEITTTRNSGCCTFGPRFSLHKKVKNMAKAMKELRQDSDNFTTIANPPQPEAMVSINIRSTIEFDSRKRVEDEIMSSLRDEGTNKVGICGMGGVGKTTMAKTIMYRAREELGFEETVMTVVDKFKIQVDIAKSLGLTLSTEGSLSSKAHELRTRLSAGTRRCLIVIDDVWEKLELEELGIPCSNTCKVLITSRNSHILEAMDVEKLHAVQVLSETEAWELFKSKAGSCIEQQNVVAVARQFVDECKGLPLALVTVGMVLKDKASIPWWNTALRQLKSANPSHMPEVIQSVYQPLRLSYEMLESEVQKTLFLLCCLFPKDGDIPVETLANICMGLLHMYEDITSSRDTTFFLVERLKDRFLLLDGCNENHVKMHDVVRDVAIFIAAEEKRIKCNECTWISPNIGERIGAHGGLSLFPNLHLLWIDCESRDKELEIQNDFFDGMRELKVILIKCRSLQRLPETIGLLKNLQTLVLESCESLESISVVGELVNLEILICRDCRKVESLPVEIGRLSRLRLLELSGCWNLKTIAPGIISNLINLEELIVKRFGGWEARIVEGERKNASLCELEHLSRLTSLIIEIRDSGLAAEKLHLSPNMLKFDITIGDRLNLYSSWEKTLRLESSRDINLGKWIHECVRNVEYLHLEGDWSTVLDLQVALNLKELDIRKCSTVKNLVNTSFHQLEHLRLERLNELEEICDILNLKKLSSISIEECGRLRSLFSLLVMESGGCFLQLERLEIRYCEMMEQVVLWNEEEQNQINIHIPLLFPKLEHIQLYSLPSLTSFIKGIQGIEFPQLAEIDIEHCPLLKDFVCSGSPTHYHGDDNDSIHLFCDSHKVKFGKLSILELTMGRNLCLQAPMDSFTSLSELHVCGLEGVKSLFSFSITESSCVSQLEQLWISSCDMMEQVILLREEEIQRDIDMITLFPNLKILYLSSLPRLTSLSKGIENIKFHLPPRMKISNCPLLMESCASPHYQNDDYRHLFCKPHHKVEFDRLKELEIGGSLDNKIMRRNWCPQIPMIDLFAGLCKFDVYGLHGMESLFPWSIARMMPNIKWLGIGWCGEMVRVIEDDAEAQTTPPILLFPNLEFLLLDGLPKLRSFCEWRCGLHLSSLLSIIIKDCDMMEELTSGPLYTPNLQTFKIDNHDFNGKDVNSALQLNRTRKQEEGMKSLFPCSIAQMMRNIENLDISWEDLE